MHDFKDKSIVITGVTGGIGYAICKLFLSAGAKVIGTGTNQDKLDKLQSELSENFTAVNLNLQNKEEAANLISNLEKIDILVCNAGITKDTLAMRMSDDSFAEVIDINLAANFSLNREAIKKMLRNKFGRIINISSIVGVTGNAGQANYCASKAGLIGMSKALALEVAKKNITVNVVAPGFIKTNMTDKLNDAQVEAILSKVPMAEMGSAEDIAQAVMFLASEEARYITGHTLHVNGGMFMN